MDAFTTQCAAVVIVDVLSFSTAVDVAVSRGATVLPCLTGEGAAAFAARHDAVLAAPRGEGRFSLSPQSMMAAGPGDRIVLPSPNGATLCAAAAAGSGDVFVACLRNASAVGDVAAEYETVAVVAAGERWPDGSLRPALEDLVGAGAVLRMLDPAGMSPEAAAARSMPVDASAITACVSGRELIARGYAGDVAMAIAVDESRSVPRLEREAIRAAR